jgi:hypothetical protein
MTVYTEGLHTGEYLVSEANGYLSREVATIAGGNYVAGTVLGKIGHAATASVAAAGAGAAGANTGNGTLTMDATAPVASAAKVGIYTVKCIAVATNGGTFRVTDPDGFLVGDVAVGATYSDDVKFAIADGATDFVVGDGFAITVAVGSGKYTGLDPSKATGAEVAVAILYEGCDASTVDQKRTITARSSEVNGLALAWPAGITDQQKATAIANLAGRGIIVRS